jgi:hypothetical protein
MNCLAWLFISPVTVIMLSVLAAAGLGYVIAQNMTNITGVNMTNTKIAGNGTGGNATASNTQTNSVLEEGNNMGIIADAPKCLGSALCPD